MVGRAPKLVTLVFLSSFGTAWNAWAVALIWRFFFVIFSFPFFNHVSWGTFCLALICIEIGRGVISLYFYFHLCKKYENRMRTHVICIHPCLSTLDGRTPCEFTQVNTWSTWEQDWLERLSGKLTTTNWWLKSTWLIVAKHWSFCICIIIFFLSIHIYIYIESYDIYIYIFTPCSRCAVEFVLFHP